MKEPLPAEYRHLRNQILFTYFHLAAAPPELTAALLGAGSTAVAYETVESSEGRRPLLAPMSAIAGALAPLVGSYYLARFNGGRGTLLTNMPGAYPRTATIALTDATLPYALRLANDGLAAVASDSGFANGVNVHAGRIHCRAVAEALGQSERYAPWPPHG